MGLQTAKMWALDIAISYRSAIHQDTLYFGTTQTQTTTDAV